VPEGRASSDHLAEAFLTLQRARSTAASRALKRGSVRLALARPAARQLLREEGAVKARLEALDAGLIALRASPVPGDTAARQKLEAERERLRTRLDAIGDELRAAVPALMSLLESAPTPLDEARHALRPREVLVAFLCESDVTWVAVVRREGASLRRLAVTRADLADRVRRIREAVAPARSLMSGAESGIDGRGLEPVNDWQRAFPILDAHALFRTLLGGPDVALAAGEQLVIVPDGPLAALSFSVLAMDAPIPAGDGGTAHVTWLGLEHPLIVLPSIPSLVTGRRVEASKASKPFFGIADPDLSIRVTADSGLVEPDWQSHLARLSETRSEVVAMAKSLGADPETSVLAGSAATEPAVGGAALDGYRVVAFATHGLMAGELGLAQPALVLTPSNTKGAGGDGLLTVEEILGLSLDADWVILSACNTAAGDAPSSSEWLSGLAKAFLFAGARSLLVSQWPVPSASTVTLTTTLLEGVARDGLEPAEAHRRAMAAVQRIPRYSHPRYWAGFNLVGVTRLRLPPAGSHAVIPISGRCPLPECREVVPALDGHLTSFDSSTSALPVDSIAASTLGGPRSVNMGFPPHWQGVRQ
jgi:hypothetical protein